MTMTDFDNEVSRASEPEARKSHARVARYAAMKEAHRLVKEHDLRDPVYPDEQITVNTENWRDIFDMAGATPPAVDDIGQEALARRERRLANGRDFDYKVITEKDPEWEQVVAARAELPPN